MRLLDKLAEWLAAQPASVTARIAAELVADIKALTLRIRELEHELEDRMHKQAPQLLELQGCGVLTAVINRPSTPGSRVMLCAV